MNNSNQKFQNAAKTVAVTSLLTLPLLTNDLHAQVAVSKTASFTIVTREKQPSHATIVGIDNGNTVFKNDRGEFFTINPQTGDLDFIAATKWSTFKMYRKDNTSSKTLIGIKFPEKEGSEVTILGVDKDGDTIHQNSRGEIFYVHPTTGDFIYL